MAAKYKILSVRQLAILMLSYKEKLKFREIRRQIDLSPAAMSRALDGLSRMNLMKRERDEGGDGRDVFCAITDEGKHLVEAIMKK